MTKISPVYRLARGLPGALLFSLALLFAPAATAAQTPEGVSKIVFVSLDHDARTMALMAVNPDGTNLIELVVDAYFFNPVISPDGRQVAFMVEPPNAGRRDVYVMGMDGTHLRRLVAGRTPTPPNGQVAWSPDSREIIYGALDFNRHPIGFFRVGLDGSPSERITFPGMYDPFRATWVAWSPDGQKIAVNTLPDDLVNGQILVANADGSGATPYPAQTASGEAFDHLAWSPDGQYALLHIIPGMRASEPQPLVIASADGSDSRALVTPPPNYIGSPAWSPDSRQVVFVAIEPGNDFMPGGELFVVNVDGANVHALNVPVDVNNVGTSWGLIPTDVTLPSAPVSFTSATG